MRLTTKGRYAVTAMLDLAVFSIGEPVPLADIARRQDISLAYLEQLFTRLRKLELVTSARGPGGGYTLARSADTISVADVVLAVEEGMDATRCGGMENCQNESQCLTHDLWSELSDHISSFLAARTLGDLAARPGVRAVADRQLKIEDAPSVARQSAVIPVFEVNLPN